MVAYHSWRILARCNTVSPEIDIRRVRNFLRRVLSHPALKSLPSGVREVSVLFTTDRSIQNLNAKFRGKDKPTDVLSFPLIGTADNICRSLGDIVISVPTAKRQARKLKATLDHELKRLLIHGTLHLCGFDHEGVSIRKAKEMFNLEEKLFTEVANSSDSLVH